MGATAADTSAPAMQATRVDGRGPSVAELSQEGPLFLVFLRHAGCTFHREALADLREASVGIRDAGARLGVVHMGSGENRIQSRDARYDLTDTPHFPDPERRLYQALGLPRGNLGQLFGWREFARGARACVVERHGVGALVGDGFQLGGLALVCRGKVAWSRALVSASERPDYAAEARAAMAALRHAAG